MAQISCQTGIFWLLGPTAAEFTYELPVWLRNSDSMLGDVHTAIHLFVKKN